MADRPFSEITISANLIEEIDFFRLKQGLPKCSDLILLGLIAGLRSWAAKHAPDGKFKDPPEYILQKLGWSERWGKFDAVIKALKESGYFQNNELFAFDAEKWIESQNLLRKRYQERSRRPGTDESCNLDRSDTVEQSGQTGQNGSICAEPNDLDRPERSGQSDRYDLSTHLSTHLGKEKKAATQLQKRKAAARLSERFNLEHFALQDIDDKFIAGLRIDFNLQSDEEVFQILDYIHEGMEKAIFSRPNERSRPHKLLRLVFPEALAKFREERKNALFKIQMKTSQEAEKKRRQQEEENEAKMIEAEWNNLNKKEQSALMKQAKAECTEIGARPGQPKYDDILEGFRRTILLKRIRDKKPHSEERAANADLH